MIPGNRPEDAMMKQICDGPIGDALSQHVHVGVYYQEVLFEIITAFLDSVKTCSTCEAIIPLTHIYCPWACGAMVEGETE